MAKRNIKEADQNPERPLTDRSVKFVEAEVIGTSYLPADEERGYQERFAINCKDADNTEYDFVAYVDTDGRMKRLRIAVLGCDAEDFGDIAEGTRVLLQIGWNERKNVQEVVRLMHIDKPRRNEIKAEVYGNDTRGR